MLGGTKDIMSPSVQKLGGMAPRPPINSVPACKLLRLLPDRHMSRIIMEMVRNCSFTLTTGNSKRSRLRCLKNGVPQGSVLAPLLFSMCTSDLPTTVSRKYAYTDDLAIIHADGDWQAVEGMLSKDMATVSEYPQTWKLKLSTTKTVSAVFHFSNKEAKRELKVNHNNETLPFCSEPKYLRITLDRWLTYRRHLESLRKKLTSRVALLRRLSGSGWGAGATTLRTATLALVHSTAEYCIPVWCRSAHTRLIDPAIHDPLRIVTGCLRPTPADNLPILPGIQPAELRCKGATLSLSRRAMEPGHLLHSALTCPSSANARRLKARHPFVPAAQQLISSSDNNNRGAAQWADHQWNAEWAHNPTRLRIFIPDTGTHPPGMTLPRTAWVRLNRCRTSPPVSDVSAIAYTHGIWSPLRSVSVTQQKKPSTMLSSNVQSIDLPMDCMAWRFWMTRQMNGCSRSGAAKQWIERADSNDEECCSVATFVSLQLPNDRIVYFEWTNSRNSFG